VTNILGSASYKKTTPADLFHFHLTRHQDRNTQKEIKRRSVSLAMASVGGEVVSNKQVILRDYVSGFPKESDMYITTAGTVKLKVPEVKNPKHDSKQLFITIYAELNYEAINNSINKISKAIKKQTQIFW
jgi:hypothetical protein